jgi:hypothetical protein
MIFRMRLTVSLLLAVALAAAIQPVLARERIAPGFVAVGGASDAGAAARQAAAMTGGRVLDVQTHMQGERPLYLVRVLLGDGRVRVIQIEGASARGFGAYRD